MLYPVVIHQDGASAFGVTVPDLPGCFSAGDTLEEAISNVREAIDLHMECMVEDGETIPQPSHMEDLTQIEELSGGVWILVDIDITKYLGGVDRLNITLPHLLVTKIDRMVEGNKLYKSRSQFLAEASMRLLAASH
ncbi:type II toxin-antitoxin system HicB family antitoxin [Neptuniibacter sp. CAU 1671]|uniref:type II toxin-antitoxin system HicB family antitoxin n=1 Tax=Neptuniibacter sp. CAU 1671 TaxID=3032593 RepID=UPI0023DB9554|nr:type II toxin-antitoxin system HicB family antitoxin [Neptuniibacter sp. CAU 1671]MDF2180965.1 type II toxin-antitoxin system HicB family antitoxin [Neptuniibacter sp. CAU 1671]